MEADLRGLATKGDASAIHEFHSESVGLTSVCSQPRREVTVDPSVTGEPLAEDLRAYFYAQRLDNPCGTLVLAYHNQGEAETEGTYTAGWIKESLLASVTLSICPSVEVDPFLWNVPRLLLSEAPKVGQDHRTISHQVCTELQNRDSFSRIRA
jgi:hypothetical protein